MQCPVLMVSAIGLDKPTHVSPPQFTTSTPKRYRKRNLQERWRIRGANTGQDRDREHEQESPRIGFAKGRSLQLLSQAFEVLPATSHLSKRCDELFRRRGMVPKERELEMGVGENMTDSQGTNHWQDRDADPDLEKEPRDLPRRKKPALLL